MTRTLAKNALIKGDVRSLLHRGLVHKHVVKFTVTIKASLEQKDIIERSTNKKSPYSLENRILL